MRQSEALLLRADYETTRRWWKEGYISIVQGTKGELVPGEREWVDNSRFNELWLEVQCRPEPGGIEARKSQWNPTHKRLQHAIFV